MRVMEPDKQDGFTLGETLAALAVTAIGLSLAVPGLQALTRGNDQTLTVNQWVGSLHQARSEAVTRNARVSLCTSKDGLICNGGDWSDGWIVFLDEDANLLRSPAETLLDQVPAPGLALHSTQFTDALSYAADGRANGRATDVRTGEFAVCEYGARTAARVVIVQPNGLPALAGHGRNGLPLDCPRPPEA